MRKMPQNHKLLSARGNTMELTDLGWSAITLGFKMAQSSSQMACWIWLLR